MRITALKQWICDTCGELIEKPEEGTLLGLQRAPTRPGVS